MTVIESVMGFFRARASFHLSRCVDEKLWLPVPRCERVALVLSAVSGRCAARNYFSHFHRIFFCETAETSSCSFSSPFPYSFQTRWPTNNNSTKKCGSRHARTPSLRQKFQKPIRMRMRRARRKEEKSTSPEHPFNPN